MRPMVRTRSRIGSESPGSSTTRSSAEAAPSNAPDVRDAIAEGGPFYRVDPLFGHTDPFAQLGGTQGLANTARSSGSKVLIGSLSYSASKDTSS